MFLLALIFGVYMGSDDVVMGASLSDVSNFLKDNIQHRPVTENGVSFFLYTSKNKENGVEMDPKNLENLRNEKSTIIFVTHGWKGNSNGPFQQNLKNAFLLRDESSKVILVDWKGLAGQSYLVASSSTFGVAQHICNLIVDLNMNYGIAKDNFLLVGHSLGAHISGFAGKMFQDKTEEKLPRIVGLDPAGPLFYGKPIDQRLSPSDAKVVQVIHSDGDINGFKDPLGTIDFFPNGGSNQPGCMKVDMKDIRNIARHIGDAFSCSHKRSFDYFTEAVEKPNEFMAEKCEGWNKFTKHQCGDTEKVPMGDITTTLTGNFYLKTNDKPPFSEIN